MSVKALLVLIISTLASSAIMADFQSYSKEWPNDIADEETTVVETVDTSTAIQDLPDVEPRVSENKRLYIRFALNASKTEVRSILNKSQPPLGGLGLAATGLQKNDISWEVGLGTKIDMTRYELEYIHHKKINFNPSPLFKGNSASLTSELTNRAILLNFYYDFDNFRYLKPYVGATLGVVWNKTRSALTGGGVGNGSAISRSTYGVAWGGRIGGRIPFWSNWSGDLGYRYTGQSKVYWKDGRSILNIDGRYVFSGFYLGVNYII